MMTRSELKGWVEYLHIYPSGEQAMDIRFAALSHLLNCKIDSLIMSIPSFSSKRRTQPKTYTRDDFIVLYRHGEKRNTTPTTELLGKSVGDVNKSMMSWAKTVSSKKNDKDLAKAKQKELDEKYEKINREKRLRLEHKNNDKINNNQ